MPEPEDQLRKWNAEAVKLLRGRTIRIVAYVPVEEFGRALSLVLDDGTEINVLRDEEGNGPGVLHLHRRGLDVVLPAAV